MIFFTNKTTRLHMMFFDYQATWQLLMCFTTGRLRGNLFFDNQEATGPHRVFFTSNKASIDVLSVINDTLKSSNRSKAKYSLTISGFDLCFSYLLKGLGVRGLNEGFPCRTAEEE